MSSVTINGQEYPVGAVIPITITLTDLMERDPVAMFELREICRNPQHKLFPPAIAKLHGLRMLEPNNQPHDLTREIVNRVVVGEMLDIRLDLSRLDDAS